MLKRALVIGWYDWRANRHWLLLPIIFFSLFALSSLRLVSNSIQETMLADTKTMVGADWILESALAPNPEWLAYATALGLGVTTTVETSTVVAHQEQSILASVKSVGKDYPLAGTLAIKRDVLATQTHVQTGPEPGEVWVAPRLYHQLELVMGNQLAVGYANLKITALVLEEPDRAGFAYNLAPRIMIHATDLPATALVQPNSRVKYTSLFQQGDGDWNTFNSWISDRLGVHDKLVSSLDLRSDLKSSIEKASRYYQLIGVVGFLLSGAALFLCLDRYLRKQYELIALLKTLGMGIIKIANIYLLHWLLVSFIVSILVILATKFFMASLIYWVEAFAEINLIDPGLGLVFESITIGLLWIWLLGSYYFYQILKQAPAGILAGASQSNPKQQGWLGIVIGISLLGWASFYGKAFFFMLISLAAWGALVAVLIFLVGKILKSQITRLSYPIRLILRQYLFRPKVFLLQMITLSFVVFSYVSVHQLKEDLFNQWQQQIPEDAPNYFALNIFGKNVNALKAYLNEAQLTHSDFYPIVRGRLIKINEREINHNDEDNRQTRNINRELSLTFTENLPFKNELVEGKWFEEVNISNQVSVEAELAEDLGITLNDELTFSIANQLVTAKVTSLRTLDWNTLTPNFYMIFKPGLLDDQIFTYMLSLHVPVIESKKIAELSRTFPEINIFDIQALIDKVTTIKDYMALVIGLGNLMLSIAVFIIMFVCVANTWDERIKTYKTAQNLGLAESILIKLLISEYVFIGLGCGLIAAGAAQAASYWGFTQILEVNWSLNLGLILLTPLFTAIFCALFSGAWACFYKAKRG